MKKIFTLLLIVTLSLTACSSKNKDTDVQQKQEVEVTPTPIPNVEYKDDVFSCLYNDSVLSIFTDTDNKSFPFICFSDNRLTMSDDVSNGTILFAATQTLSTISDKHLASNYKRSDVTKVIFDSLFQIKDLTTPTVTEIENNIFEYTAKVNDTEYLGRLFHIDDKTMTVAACRILPGEKQEYIDALKSCYESIKYIKTETDPLEELNEQAKEAAKDAQIIESGDLYDSIKTISEKPIRLIKMKEQYSLSINMDNPKLFFNKCEMIFKKVFKQTESVVFGMHTDDHKQLASFTVIANSSSTYPLYSTFLICDENIKKEVESAYAKNKYWQSIDYDNLQKKELQKLKDEFSK